MRSGKMVPLIQPERRLGCGMHIRRGFEEAYDARDLDKLPPKTPLGRAVGYADQQWPFFERCFTRGDFEIDNGAPEREIRTIAIGRRNFLFSGSVDAAKRLCAAYTLVVGAKRVGVDPFIYVKDLLDKLSAGWTIDRVAELTPIRWAAAKAAE